ncbi:MAG TPA: tyrosine-type recombinase/integrase [Candidatus Binatia bacterium]|nr:tyrosine-type recombinase/integrase [Candidatus Binatia bacterium]
MASLRKKDRSPFWFACYTLPDGRRTQRSTGTTERRKALALAVKYEQAADAAAAGRFTEAAARRVIADIYALANAEAMPNSTCRSFFKVWLDRKSLEADENTHERYTGVATQFLDHIGRKADMDIKKITPTDVAAFRDAAAQRLAVGTSNLMLKVLRSAFAVARREGLTDDNPAERVAVLKKRQTDSERRPFTLSELKRLMDVANDEWRGMILFGLYTGQRLGDIAMLKRLNLDLDQNEIRLKTGKTGRRQILPLTTPLLEYVKKLTTGDAPDAPLFARAYEIVQKQGRTGTLSNQFHKILVDAGLAKKRSHRSTGKGRSASREQNDISFHSLRHTATTLLKAAGVSDAVAREFVGHDSAAVSQNYTHIPTDTLRKAANKLPNILK